MNPQDLADALEDCKAAGFVLPFHIAVIACNGKMLAGTYYTVPDGSLDFERKFLSGEHAKFKVPINVVIVDSRGEAARMVVGTSGKRAVTMLH